MWNNIYMQAGEIYNVYTGQHFSYSDSIYTSFSGQIELQATD